MGISNVYICVLLRECMNKRGLSQIITTVLIILLGIAAIVILWGFIKIFLDNLGEQHQAKFDLSQERIVVTKVVFNGNLATLNLSLRKDSGKEFFEGYETIEETQEIDLISTVDVSESMLCSSGLVPGNIPGDVNETGGQIRNPVGWRCFVNQSNCGYCNGTWEEPLASTRDANKALTNSILNINNLNRVGFVAYSGVVHYDVSINLTNNKQNLDSVVDLWTTQYSQDYSNGTGICKGINVSASTFASMSPNGKKKVMIVMSDGSAQSNCSITQTGSSTFRASQDAIITACNVKQQFGDDLVIYSIGLGNDANESTLTQIAQCGGGRYYNGTADNIIEVYTKISEEVVPKFRSIKTIDYILVLFYYGSEGESFVRRIDNPPSKIYQIVNYDFDVPDQAVGNITRVEIYPGITLSNGREITSDVPVDIYDVKKQ
jgi:hypothetical protein